MSYPRPGSITSSLECLTLRSIRRVTTESSTGSTSSHRVHLKLTLQVDKVLYSALALSEQQQQAPSGATNGASAPAVSSGTSGTSTLHVSGRVTSENPHVKKGAFHTLDLEVGRDFTIIKGIGSWDSVARERIKEMTEPGRGADVGAIVCGEGEQIPSCTIQSSSDRELPSRSRQYLCHHESHDHHQTADRCTCAAETQGRSYCSRRRQSVFPLCPSMRRDLDEC